jgi:hypothetical protein
VVVVIGAAILISACAFALQGTPYFGHFVDAGHTASALGGTIGDTAATFFAIVLLNASLIGAGTVTLTTSYAAGDLFGGRASLHRSFREATGFYLVFSALILGAAAVVLIPGAPLGVITLAVQALAGILLPMTTVLLLMLCNDRDVLGPWRNPPWLQAFAGVIVGVLMLLSMILTVTTIFPSVDVTKLALIGGLVLLLALSALGVGMLRARQGADAVTFVETSPEVPREQWTMSPLTLLSRPQWSPRLRAAMLALASYMVIATALLVVKTVQLAGG